MLPDKKASIMRDFGGNYDSINSVHNNFSNRNEVPLQENPQCEDLHKGKAYQYSEKGRTHQSSHS